MARSKCLDNLRRKRRIQVNERRRLHFGEGVGREAQTGPYVAQTFSDKHAGDRPSSITKSRYAPGSPYKSKLTRFKDTIGARPIPGKVPRKVKKEIKKLVKHQYDSVMY